jgi:hypothetical protein
VLRDLGILRFEAVPICGRRQCLPSREALDENLALREHAEATERALAARAISPRASRDAPKRVAAAAVERSLAAPRRRGAAAPVARELERPRGGVARAGAL